MPCESCGYRNSDDAAFCGLCGSRLLRSEPRVDPHVLQPPPLPNSAPSPSISDATRYLCAVVQLNSRLAQRVIGDIVNQQYKAPPLSPGVDLMAVVRHATSARARQVGRDALLTFLTFLIAIGWWRFRAGSGLVIVAAVGMAWLIVFGEQLVATYGVLANQLRPNRYHPESASSPSSARFRRRLEVLNDHSEGNVTVYGAYGPFIGSGVTIGAWSFALDIRRSSEGRAAEAFTVHDLHDYVQEQIVSLRLGRLTVEDRVFVDGRDLRGDRRFLVQDLGAPVARIESSLMRSLMAEPEDRVRPYTCFRIAGWCGQLVLSTFLRFVVTPQHLFVEVSHSLLTPILERYQQVDRLLPRPTIFQVAEIGTRSLMMMPLQTLCAPMSVGRAIFGPFTRKTRRVQQRREIVSNLSFNYGADSSPREAVSDSRYQRYFQELDKDLYLKVVEKSILRSLVTFLEERGIDTHELIERQTTILNNGVYVTGGAAVTADNIAAGLGAQAKSGLRGAAAGATSRAATVNRRSGAK